MLKINKITNNIKNLNIFVYIQTKYNKHSAVYMEELINSIITDTIKCFDIPFCITCNIATYVAVKAIININKFKVTTWFKRIVFLLVSFIIATVYCFTGSELKTIFNSIIIAPVSWSWIFKPICDKFKIGYNAKCKVVEE